jgi:uncharacterized protein (DUF885 family)
MLPVFFRCAAPAGPAGPPRSRPPRRPPPRRRETPTTGCSAVQGQRRGQPQAQSRCQRLFRGDLRYADRLGDNITDEYYAGERAARADLPRSTRSIRAPAQPTDQLAYDVFEYSTKDTLRGLQPDMLALTAVRPINHFFGFHTFYPTFASGKGAAPFKTLADYENNLKRHKEFVTYSTARSAASARASRAAWSRPS